MESLEEKYVVTTTGMSVVVAGDIPHHMQTCNHEEADTRMLIHLQDALDNDAITCLVRTVDTAIFVGKFHKLLESNPAADVWLAFGAGKWFRHIHVNAIYNALGKHKIDGITCFSLFY